MEAFVSKYDAAPKQRLNYLETLLSIEAGLEEAIRLLGLQQDDATSDLGRECIRGQVADLNAVRASVQATLSDYLFDDPLLRPPDEAAVAAVAVRAQRVFGLTPVRTCPAEIMSLADELIESWSSIRVAQGAASHRADDRT